MKRKTRITRRAGIALAGLSVAALLAVAASRESGDPRPAAVGRIGTPESKDSAVRFDDHGRLLPPTDYREWIYVGAPVTPNDMNGGKAAFPEFHSVYINPEAYRDYAKTGVFPDGTVVVKELISVATKRASSGRGYFMGEFTGLEVAVKDRTRFQDEPGNWAYFSFGHEYPLKDRAEVQPVANCSACHGAGADDDYVFTQYYPVLRVAKDTAEAR
jgi:hypothetical protein